MKLRIINVKSNNQSIVKDKKVQDMEFHAINLNNTSITLLSNDGFIGICGWADGYNLTPFAMAFKDWCDYMKGKVTC